MKSKPEEQKQKSHQPSNAAPLARDEPQATTRDDAPDPSEDLSLEVIHPDAAGIDIGNESHYAATASQIANRYGSSGAPPPS